MFLTSCAAARLVAAQGAVSGTVLIAERAGEASNDLASAVVYLDRIGSNDKLSSNARIAMHERQFLPRVRVVGVGRSVEFPNEDPFRHNVFSNAGPGAFDLGLYARGESRAATFARPGIYPIFCNIHSKMTAYVLAVSSAHVVFAGSDGRFEIPAVPAGTYKLHVWHERGGELSREIDVGASGLANVQMPLDARNYRVVQHKNKFGQEYPASSRDRY